MPSVATSTTDRKAPKAFYAHLYETAGILTKVHETLYFMVPETGEVTAIEPEDCTFLTVLGEVDTAMRQWVADMEAGGYHAVACQRAQEVA